MSPTVTELLRDTVPPALNFESSPPRTPEEQPRFETTAAKLGRFHPAFLSVTYGASGSTRDRTVVVAAVPGNVQRATVVSRLICVSQSTDDLLRTLDAFTDAGINDILVTRGDTPGGLQQPWERHPDGLGNATKLARLIKAHGDSRVGVATFLNVRQPDNDPELDARIVTKKAAVGVDYAITQLFFESHCYVELVNRVCERGSQIPITSDVAPLTVITQIERFASLADCLLPEDFVTALRTARNPAEVRSIGPSRAVNLCREFLAAGASGLQFFTQNRWKVTSEVLDAIGWGDRVS